MEEYQDQSYIKAVGRPNNHFIFLGAGMIIRIWHGWTTPQNANRYEDLLREEIFVGIKNREIAGYRGIQLLRHNGPDEVEFITIMQFDSLDAVREFAGEDFESAVVPPKARALLVRFDERSMHYELRDEIHI